MESNAKVIFTMLQVICALIIIHISATEIRPIVTFTSSLPNDPVSDVIEVGARQEVAVECVSSGPFPGYAMWKKKVMDQDVRYNVTEIDLTDTNFTSLFTLPAHLCENEVLGDVYAYRYNATRVVLGTRSTDVFGASIGISIVANGTYECYAKNDETSSGRLLHLKVLGNYSINFLLCEFHGLYFLGNKRPKMNQTHVRFSVQLIEDVVERYACIPNSTLSCELAFGIISTGVLNSLVENNDATVSADCYRVGR